jgi:hypothetical protein
MARLLRADATDATAKPQPGHDAVAFGIPRPGNVQLKSSDVLDSGALR